MSSALPSGFLEDIIKQSFSLLAGISAAMKVREIKMLTAGGGPTSSSEVSGSRLPREKT